MTITAAQAALQLAKVAAKAADDKKADHTIVLEVGDVFGEMSVLTGDRTVADVIAGNRCLVLLIPQTWSAATFWSIPRPSCISPSCSPTARAPRPSMSPAASCAPAPQPSGRLLRTHPRASLSTQTLQ